MKCVAEGLTTLRSVLIVSFFLAITIAPAHAKVQFFSTFSANGVPAQECRDASAIVTPLIAQFHGPADWTWIIVCDEAAWKRVQVHIDQFDPIGYKILGTTNLEGHVTYIRGFYVLHPASTNALAQPDHTIAHELGHITMNTHDERRAERKAEELLKVGL
ncbi:hypothetical protein [Tunturiibacter gelidiferens]|uniref:hypothetical protein n=1 Tax=Tunturiibacter gelidiferens TaxID=3069689 RepID=UPI003D9AF208